MGSVRHYSTNPKKRSNRPKIESLKWHWGIKSEFIVSGQITYTSSWGITQTSPGTAGFYTVAWWASRC